MDKASALQEAEQFLRAILADGPKALAEIEAAADAEMISSRTLKRAKKELGIRSAQNGMDVGWTWQTAEEGQENAKRATQKCWPPSKDSWPASGCKRSERRWLGGRDLSAHALNAARDRRA